MFRCKGHEDKEVVAKRSQRRDTIVEVKHIEKDGKSDNLKVMYTNIDGVLSSILELRDYLRLNKPDVVCITEREKETERESERLRDKKNKRESKSKRKAKARQ